MANRLYPFLFFHRRRFDRTVWLHDARDLLAFCEISAALAEDGFRYGGPLFNIPPPEDPAPDAPRRRIDVGDVDGEDIILDLTRAPLSDREHGGRKRVPRGWTEVEDLILECLGNVFEELSRSEAALRSWVRARLPREFADWGQIEFYSNHPGHILRTNPRDGTGWRKRPRDSRTTAGYLLRVEHLWRGGPGLLAAFSMSGDTTLLWARCLRTRFPELLSKPGFVIAELTVPQIPPLPTSLREAGEEQCEARIVLSAGPEIFAAS